MAPIDGDKMTTLLLFGFLNFDKINDAAHALKPHEGHNMSFKTHVVAFIDSKLFHVESSDYPFFVFKTQENEFM